MPDPKEQLIGCWRLVEDLQPLIEYVCETDELDRDTIANILIGLTDLYNLKFKSMSDSLDELLDRSQ